MQKGNKKTSAPDKQGRKYTSWYHPYSPISHDISLIKYAELNSLILQHYNGRSRTTLSLRFSLSAPRPSSMNFLCSLTPAENSLRQSLHLLFSSQHIIKLSIRILQNNQVVKIFFYKAKSTAYSLCFSYYCILYSLFKYGHNNNSK